MLAQANGPAADEGSGALIVWAIVLIGLALALFFIEVIVPSGGILGIGSAASLVIGVILLFQVDETLGLIGATVSLIALPFAVGLAITLWPDTPIGRLLTLSSPPSRGDVRAADQPSKGAATGQTLSPGDHGKALTELRPVGTCLIQNRREECLASAGVIEPGTPVEVVDVDGLQIKVRPVRD